MKPNPLYVPHNLNPAYKLCYSWAGFPHGRGLFPETAPDDLFDRLGNVWKTDGIHLLEHRWGAEQIQLTFSSKPSVSPVLLAARAKGRLQYALRQLGLDIKFARNFAIRSLGNNTLDTVERYVREQLDRTELADPKYRARLEQCMWEDTAASLNDPVCSGSGRYYYCLHLVLVTSDRYRIGAEGAGMTLRDTCLKVAKKYGYSIGNLSVMPDHLHIALRGRPDMSPEEIALSFQNNTAWTLGRVMIWTPTYYAGTVGAYTMRAVRNT